MRATKRIVLTGMSLLLASCGQGTEVIEEGDLTAPVAGAIAKSFQDGVLPTTSYFGTRDNQLSQISATSNYATGTLIRVDGDDPADSHTHKSALLKWDLSTIPAGSAVQSVVMTLNVHETTTQPYALFQVLRNWSETSATWNQFASGAPWQVGGAGGALDRGSTSLGQVMPASSGLYGMSLNASGVAVVQKWVNTPTTNLGLLIYNSTNWDGFTFDTSEVGTPALRPKLTVTYVPPAPPAPPPSGGLQLYDDFNGSLFSLSSDSMLTPNGLWKTGYVSQGYAKTVQDPSNANNKYLVMSPKLDVLRAARLDTTKSWKGIHGRLRARLDAQLQPAVSWYTLWPLIAYVNDTTHYYFNLKTTGWELGKKDNDHPAQEELQEYIATGNSPKAVIGQWNTIEWWVVKDANSNNLRIRVDVNGATLVNVVDNQPWQRNGTTGNGASSFFMNALKKVTLYNEASQISWDDVYVSEATTIP